MSFLLCIHSYPGANEAIQRHWPFFEKSGASRIIGIGTEGGGCVFPVGQVEIGHNSYMKVDGSPDDHLCRRLLDTVRWCLVQPEERFVICEYDTVFLRELPEFSGICAHQTGGRIHNSISPSYHHNPWAFDRESGERLANWMEQALPVSQCHPNNSPDLFFGLACDMGGLKVGCPWGMFTRNTLDHDLDLAVQAVRDGAHVVHGVKTEEQLEPLIEALHGTALA
jgi:hypothetical protein